MQSHRRSHAKDGREWGRDVTSICISHYRYATPATHSFTFRVLRIGSERQAGTRQHRGTSYHGYHLSNRGKIGSAQVCVGRPTGLGRPSSAWAVPHGWAVPVSSWAVPLGWAVPVSGWVVSLGWGVPVLFGSCYVTRTVTYADVLTHADVSLVSVAIASPQYCKY